MIQKRTLISAINDENRAIILYSRLLELCSDGNEKRSLEKIIREEKEHHDTLSSILQKNISLKKLRRLSSYEK